jgi:hypothetical protein
MLRKIHIATVLSLLSLFVLFGISNSIGSTNKEPLDNCPMICVCPGKITGVDVGETVTISVILCTDVQNLYGFDIALKWDPTILEYIGHVVMAPVESYSEGVLHGPIFSLKDEADPSAGICWIACSSMPPAEPFSGNGAFFTITFEVLSISNEHAFQLVSVALSDDQGRPIDYQDPEKTEPELSNEPYRPPPEQILRRHRGDVLWWLTNLEEMQAHVRASEYSNIGAWQP